MKIDKLKIFEKKKKKKKSLTNFNLSSALDNTFGDEAKGKKKENIVVLLSSEISEKLSCPVRKSSFLNYFYQKNPKVQNLGGFSITWTCRNECFPDHDTLIYYHLFLIFDYWVSHLRQHIFPSP